LPFLLGALPFLLGALPFLLGHLFRLFCSLA
jgi:hypothetical protein